MRTRIALIAAVPVAFITMSMLSPAAPVQSTKLTSDRPTKKTGAVALPPHQLTAFHAAAPAPPGPRRSTLPFDLSAGLFAVHPIPPAPRTAQPTAANASPPAATPSATVPATAPAPPAPAPAPAIAAPPPVTTPAPPAPPAPSGPVDTVTPLQRAEWERVAMCEEGGNWSADGGRFSGGLGITRDNWVDYGGLQFAPEGAMATEDEQIMVAERIQADPPDQYGCRGW